MGVIEVEIRPGTTSGTFTAQVVRSSAGEASETVALDADGLVERLGHLQQAVLASSVSSRRLLPENEQQLQQFGRALFTALLGTGEVAGRYRASAALADAEGEGLRVAVRIEDPVLAALPWEAMYDPAIGAYVCRREQLVRRVPVGRVPAPLRVSPPLRVLGIASSPRGLPPLDVEKEKEQLTRALSRLTAAGRLTLHWADEATWAHLQELLLGGTWQVIHFVGHGDFDANQNTGVLALVGEDGRAKLVDADQFVDLLRQARPMPRLIVLNSCSGAATGQMDLFAGTAAALVRGGATAVAAMQFEITDAAAIEFSRGFYTAIAHGRGVDDAVSSGRAAIIGLSGRTLEWVTPALYLRGDETHLFTLTPAAADPPSPVEREAGEPLLGDGPAGEMTEATAPPPSPGRQTSSLGAAGEPTSTRETAPTRQKSSPRPKKTAARADSDVAHAAARPRPTRQPRPATQATPPAATWPSTVARSLTGFRRWGAFQYLAAKVAFNPQGRLLATAGSDETVRMWDPIAGTNVRNLAAHTGPLYSVAFSPDWRLLASAGKDKTIRLWNPATGEHLRALAGDAPGGVKDVAFSSDGRLLASTSWGETALWDPTTGKRRRTKDHDANGVAFSPDGHLLAVACNDKMIRLSDPTTGVRVGEPLGGHTDTVFKVAFSPDGHLLASASRDHTIRLWDPVAGTNVRSLTGHDGSVYSVAFSPDGRLLASAGWDTTVRLWDPVTGMNVHILTGHTKAVLAVAFSPDGRMLASYSIDKTVKLWT